ncbi:MAG: exosortase/archaeosortase family protein [Gammaproteobacteria bacterium]|nr:exosortase/archaeosortase family protein [Gammaproteobacteria bacterium]
MTSTAAENTNVVLRGKEKLLLVLLLLLLVLAFHQLIIGEAASDFMPNVVEAFFSVSGLSPQFAYALVAGLLWVRRKDIAAAYHGRGTPWSSMLFLVPGISLFLWGHFVGAMDLIHVSLILVGFGTARFLSGRRLTRAILPPVLILVLATPLPAVFINQIIFPMQLMDTRHSVWLLNAIGLPSLAEGDMISMAESSTHFAESCTALGFSLWLTVFALAYVYLFRITHWHAVLLVLSAPFIAYAVNLLRAFTLVLNPAMEVLTIHTVQGVVFFLIGFSLLYAVDNLLMHSLANDRKEHVVPTPASRVDESFGDKQGKLTVLVLLFTALIIASLTLPKWPAPSTRATPAIRLPDELGEWKLVENQPVSYRFLGSVRYSSTLYRSYSKNNEPVSVFIGTDDRLRRHRSLLSDKNAYPGEIGLVQERSVVDLGPDVGNAVAIVTDKGTQRLLSYSWYEGVESIAKEVLYAWLALDQSPFRRAEPMRVTRLTTFVELTPEGRMHADKRLRAFLQEMMTSR